MPPPARTRRGTRAERSLQARRRADPAGADAQLRALPEARAWRPAPTCNSSSKTGWMLSAKEIAGKRIKRNIGKKRARKRCAQYRADDRLKISAWTATSFEWTHRRALRDELNTRELQSPGVSEPDSEDGRADTKKHGDGSGSTADQRRSAPHKNDGAVQR